MLKIYGLQLFLPRTKRKDARSCRPYRQPAVYARTSAVTSSFRGWDKPGENSPLSKNWEPSAAGRMGGTQVWVTLSMFIKRNFREKKSFNYTYYTVTHKCWMALRGRGVYLALGSSGRGSASLTGRGSTSLTGDSVLGHHCRCNPVGAIVPHTGHIP